MTFDNDRTALDLLAAHYGEESGVLYPLAAGYIPTADESDAIDYLCAEWDYAYSCIQPELGSHSGESPFSEDDRLGESSDE